MLTLCKVVPSATVQHVTVASVMHCTSCSSELGFEQRLLQPQTKLGFQHKKSPATWEGRAFHLLQVALLCLLTANLTYQPALTALPLPPRPLSPPAPSPPPPPTGPPPFLPGFPQVLVEIRPFNLLWKLHSFHLRMAFKHQNLALGVTDYDCSVATIHNLYFLAIRAEVRTMKYDGFVQATVLHGFKSWGAFWEPAAEQQLQTSVPSTTILNTEILWHAHIMFRCAGSILRICRLTSKEVLSAWFLCSSPTPWQCCMQACMNSFYQAAPILRFSVWLLMPQAGSDLASWSSSSVLAQSWPAFLLSA